MFERSLPLPDAERGAFPGSRPFPNALHQAGKGDRKQLIQEQGTLPYRGRPFCYGAPGRRTVRLPAWRPGCCRRRLFICGDRWPREEDRCPRTSREPHPWAICRRERWQDALPGVRKIKGIDGREEDSFSLKDPSCLRPRRPGFRTRRAGPADHASCLRADRPCGRGVPDIAPDPSPVPRAPAAGRRPGAGPGAAAGRDGR